MAGYIFGYRYTKEHAAKLADRPLDIPYKFLTSTIPARFHNLVNQRQLALNYLSQVSLKDEIAVYKISEG